MKRIIIFNPLHLLFLIAGITNIFSCNEIFYPHNPNPKSMDPAQEALKLLESLANEQTYKEMGFASLEEVSSAELGAPVSVFTVGYDVIKSYQDNMHPNLLLTDLHEVIYPVLSDGKIRSSIGVMHDGELWEYTEIGRPNFTNALFEARNLHVPSTGRNQEDFFLVNFPALYITLIAHRLQDGSTEMAVVHGSDLIGLKANELMPRKKVFTAIAAFAKDHPVEGMSPD